jgi:Right handed beta helix region
MQHRISNPPKNRRRRRVLGPLGLVAGICALLLGGPGAHDRALAQPAGGRSASPSSGAVRRSSADHYAALRAELGRAPATTIATQVRQARQAALVGPRDLTLCAPIPPAAAELTSPGYYFLSQILPAGIGLDSPACGQALACFLGKMVAHQTNPVNPPSAHSEATLIIDRQCVVSQTLVLPNRFVLAGVGTEGRGVLAFDLPDSAAAIRFAASAGSPQRFTTIRDLNIVNASQCCGQVGIDVSNSSFVQIERVRLHDFGFGLLGAFALSIFVDKSVIHNNGFNVVIGDGSRAWRVRDTTMSQSGLIGVVFDAGAVGNLVSGGRLESNPFTAIYLRGQQNVVESSWFEGNGIGFGDHGIQVIAPADQTRILANLFSSEDILDGGASTQSCFNTDDNAFADLNTCPP